MPCVGDFSHTGHIGKVHHIINDALLHDAVSHYCGLFCVFCSILSNCFSSCDTCRDKNSKRRYDLGSYHCDDRHHAHVQTQKP